MSMMDDIFKKLNNNQLDNLKGKLGEGLSVIKEGINQLSEEKKKYEDNTDSTKDEDNIKNYLDSAEEVILKGVDALKKGVEDIVKQEETNENDEKSMNIDEYFSDDEYVNMPEDLKSSNDKNNDVEETVTDEYDKDEKEILDYISKLYNIGQDKYQEVKKQVSDIFNTYSDKKKNSNIDLLEMFKKYEKLNKMKKTYNMIKDKVNEIKDIYDNYKSLDEKDKKGIVEDNRKLQKERMMELKKNFLLALQFFNELNQESEEYFKFYNQSIIDEINNKAHEKNVRDANKKLVKDYFESFIITVDTTLCAIKKLDVYLCEEEIYQEIGMLLNKYDKVLEIYNSLNDEDRTIYYENINNACKKLYTIIEMYNEAAYSPVSMLGKPIKMIDDKDQISLENTKMAITSNDNLDLFKVIHYKESAPLYGIYNDLSYNEGDIYVGLTTDEVAIKKSHISISNVDIWSTNKGGQIHNNRIYSATSNGLKTSLDFNKLRESMYESRKQIIPYYGENVTTLSELNNVVDYGSKIYGLNNNKQIIK